MNSNDGFLLLAYSNDLKRQEEMGRGAKAPANTEIDCLNAVIVTNINNSQLYCRTMEADWFQNYSLYLWLSVQFYISFSVLFRQSYALFSGVFSKLKQYHRYICIPFNNNSSVQSSIQHYKWFICNCSTFLSLYVLFFFSCSLSIGYFCGDFSIL